jgi:universal stress protein A
MNTLQPSHLLVPVDFSETSRLAIDYALEVCAKFSARLTLLHVQKPPIVPGTELGFNYAEYLEHLSHTAAERLKELAASLPASCSARTQVLEGIPWDLIVQYAADHKVDLIVMPTHGRSGLKHLLLGSTAERVVRHAHCPVLVVRPGATSAQ